MAITVRQTLGNFQVLSVVGRGGMGEVYRARDTKLKREVAIKILPEEFSRDPDRVARFQREAEVLGSLNHPNIAAIYDMEEAEGSRFLVLEFVEGETLAERIGSDGRRFLVNLAADEGAASPITLIYNWHPGLAARENR